MPNVVVATNVRQEFVGAVAVVIDYGKLGSDVLAGLNLFARGAETAANVLLESVGETAVERSTGRSRIVVSSTEIDMLIHRLQEPRSFGNN